MKLRLLIAPQILFLLLGLQACAPRAVVETRDITFNYFLPRSALVSIDILSGEKSIRNLIHQRVRGMGTVTEAWDGLDDRGKPASGSDFEIKITISYVKLEFLPALEAPGSILSPSAIVVGGKKDDLIYYIIDAANNHVLRLDKMLNVTQQLGSFGVSQAQLMNPVDIALDSNLVLTILDAGNDQIQRFDHRGLHASSIRAITRHQGTMQIPEEFRDPRGIAFNKYGNFIVSDSGHDRLIALNDSGWLLWEAGGFGSGSGQLSDPRGIAIDAQGFIYVADTGNHRISVFNSDGQTAWEFTAFQQDESKISLRDPERLAISAQGLLFCLDGSTERIVIGDTRGGYLSEISGLVSPAGLYIKNDILYITETSQNRISRYKLEIEAEEKTVHLDSL